MTWVAVMFICVSSNNCGFAHQVAASEAECTQKLEKLMNIAAEHGAPVINGACLKLKGKEA